MEHRGVEYAILPTIPKGWRWSVRRGQSDRGGTCYNREDAVRKAKQYIENLLRREKRALN